MSLLPFLRLALFVVLERLGANPIEFITRNTGDWTLYFLCITLAITPLRRLTGWNWLIRLRRMFGLFSFFYVLLHFLTFFWFDHFFDVQEMLQDVVAPLHHGRLHRIRVADSTGADQYQRHGQAVGRQALIMVASPHVRHRAAGHSALLVDEGWQELTGSANIFYSDCRGLAATAHLL